MNVQFKKGVLDLCVLSLLDGHDRYGYELVQVISGMISVSEGSVYTVLRRLTKEGYFDTYQQESTEGPPRKYYRMTDAGKKYLTELLTDWREFNQKINEIIGGMG